MKNILLQNDKNAQQVDNPNYPKPTVAQLKKTFTSTSKLSSSYNADIKITDSDRVYLNKAQINITQKFLDKFANTELHVFENVHEDILLLNIPADDKSFEGFLLTYDKTNGNKSDNGIKKFQTYTEYFLNKLKSLKHIQIYLDRIFQESQCNVVKVQMKFGVIWESQDIAKENKFNYYYQPVHYGSVAKMPLLVVNNKNRGNMYSYSLSMLQDIRGRNSDVGESNSRVVGITSLQVTMYNCDRYAGANEALNCIVYDLVRNRYAFTVNLETLCWFGCMSYLKYPKVPGEHRNTRNKYTRELFFQFYDMEMENKNKGEKEEFEKNYPGFSIADEIERFKEFFNVSINLYKYSPDEKKYCKLHYYEKQDSQYLLNIALVPVGNGEHAIWLKEFDNAV
jgi:hypothetical protein